MVVLDGGFFEFTIIGLMKKFTVIIFVSIISCFFLNRFSRDSSRAENKSTNQSPSKTLRIPTPAPDLNTKMRELSKMIELANGPIKFEGIVVDENDIPVSEVTVEWSIILAGYFNSPPPIKNSSITDQQGLFTVEGERGRSFGVDKIIKGGYHQARDAYPVKQQEPNNPDSKKIVKFLILKDDVTNAEDLGDFHVAVNWNQGPMSIPIGFNDLELIIVVNRDNDKPFTRRNWDVKVSMSRAKLIDVGKTWTCLAPLDGYADSLYYSKKSTDQYPNFGETKYLVFKTDNQMYGQINLDFEAGLESQEKCLRFKVLVNKVGLRNLNIEQ